jgi:hypothetical protein
MNFHGRKGRKTRSFFIKCAKRKTFDDKETRKRKQAAGGKN